jgi:hypothetical protein
MGFEASKSRSNYRNHAIDELSHGAVENPIVFEYPKTDRGVENRDSMSFLSANDHKSDEFRVLEHRSTGRKEKFEGIETPEDSVVDISRGADLDRTSEL